MLRELAAKFYLEDSRNCAEALLMAANEYYKLGLTDENIRLVGGFGGGMGVGSTCGALCGALSALGAMLITTRAHDAEGFRDKCAALVHAFEEKLGSSECNRLMELYKTPETRCAKTVELAADVFEAFVDELNGRKKDESLPPLTEDEIKSVKGMGFLHNKGTRCFSARIITRNGHITAGESRCITEASELFGDGTLTFTSRMTVELPGIAFENIKALQEHLAKSGLETGGTGSKVRPVVSCKGTTCQYGLYDTFALSEKIHQRFYKGYRSVLLPHKLKIAAGGCPNNCVKPDLNDLGVIGQRIPRLNAELCRGCKTCAVEKACPMKTAKVIDGKLDFGADCNNCGRCVGKCPFHAVDEGIYGYKLCIGGRWGKKVGQGRPLSKIFTSEEELLSAMEKAILFFREQGITGERLADTVARVGFEKAEQEILGDGILARKEAILGAELHTRGGATC